MARRNFKQSISKVLEKDSRYHRESYFFLRDALDFTIRRLERIEDGVNQHVTPEELLDGIREYAISQFGPMVPTVLEHWGITTTEDFGHMVFNLVEEDVFGVQETDRLEDFCHYYSFREAFVEPFLPSVEDSSSRREAGSL